MTRPPMAKMWLQCVNGCPERHPAFRPLYACPSCGALVDVEVDAASLDREVPGHHRGVWDFHAWIAPDLPASSVVTMGEGNGPMVDVEVGGAGFQLKQCGQQPTGSFKDLGMTVLVSQVGGEGVGARRH